MCKRFAFVKHATLTISAIQTAQFKVKKMLFLRTKSDKKTFDRLKIRKIADLGVCLKMLLIGDKKVLIMKQLLLALLMLPVFAFAQTDMPQITQALNSGDIDALGTFFDDSIELSILEEEGIYNKAQALQKVRRFLSQSKVNSFTEVHQGASRSSDAQYVIGNIATAADTYRVYLYLSNNNGKTIIQELRFDRP